MIKVKGAIFDLDGTLIDSMGMWRGFGDDFLRSQGIEPDESLSEVFRSFSREQAAEYYIAQGYLTATVEEIVSAMSHKVFSYYRDEVGLKPGAYELIKGLGDMGIPMCIATASDAVGAEAALSRLGIRRFISGIFSCTEIGHSKNEPYIYRAALELLGCEKSETVVFEDALHALQTAKGDGFLTAAVYDADEPRQDKMRQTADLYLTDLSDFLKLI